MEIPRNEQDLYILISIEMMKVAMGEYLKNNSRGLIDAFLTSAMTDIDKVAGKFSEKLAKQLKKPIQKEMDLGTPKVNKKVEDEGR